MSTIPKNLYTPAEAVAWAAYLARTGTPVAEAMCEQQVGRDYGWEYSGEWTAMSAFHDPLITDRLIAPHIGGIGALAYYANADPRKPGHVTLIADNLHSALRSHCYSIDILKPGRVSLVPIMAPVKLWGMTYVGSTGAQFPRASVRYPHHA